LTSWGQGLLPNIMNKPLPGQTIRRGSSGPERAVREVQKQQQEGSTEGQSQQKTTWVRTCKIPQQGGGVITSQPSAQAAVSSNTQLQHVHASPRPKAPKQFHDAAAFAQLLARQSHGVSAAALQSQVALSDKLPAPCCCSAVCLVAVSCLSPTQIIPYRHAYLLPQAQAPFTLLPAASAFCVLGSCLLLASNCYHITPSGQSYLLPQSPGSTHTPSSCEGHSLRKLLAAASDCQLSTLPFCCSTN
jgi:hypothetical protein